MLILWKFQLNYNISIYPWCVLVKKKKASKIDGAVQINKFGEESRFPMEIIGIWKSFFVGRTMCTCFGHIVINVPHVRKQRVSSSISIQGFIETKQYSHRSHDKYLSIQKQKKINNNNTQVGSGMLCNLSVFRFFLYYFLIYLCLSDAYIIVDLIVM